MMDRGGDGERVDGKQKGRMTIRRGRTEEERKGRTDSRRKTWNRFGGKSQKAFNVIPPSRRLFYSEFRTMNNVGESNERLRSS